MAQRFGGRPPGLIPDGPKIRQMRRERGIRVMHLAARLGCHRESITRIEGSSRPMSAEFASQLARALGLIAPDGRVMVEEILADDGEDDGEDELRPTG